MKIDSNKSFRDTTFWLLDFFDYFFEYFHPRNYMHAQMGVRRNDWYALTLKLFWTVINERE